MFFQGVLVIKCKWPWRLVKSFLPLNRSGANSIWKKIIIDMRIQIRHGIWIITTKTLWTFVLVCDQRLLDCEVRNIRRGIFNQFHFKCLFSVFFLKNNFAKKIVDFLEVYFFMYHAIYIILNLIFSLLVVYRCFVIFC